MPSRAGLEGVPRLRAGAGVCARRRSNFLSSRRKKVTKERATLHAASLRFAAGNLWCSCVGRAAELATRCALRSNNRSESEHEARALRRACRPTPCAPRRIVKGTRESDIHTGHRCARPPLAGASASRCAGAAERSKGPWGCLAVGCSAVHPLLAAPAAGRLWGGMGVGAPMLRALTRRGCPSGAAQQQSEFHGAPRNRHDAGCPVAQRRGRRLGVALSLVTFFRRRERKLLACRATPGSRPEPKHAAQTSTPQASTSSARTARGISSTTKTIAANA